MISGLGLTVSLDYIEHLIEREAPFEQVMRLLILYCNENGGLKQKLFDTVRHEILQAYGFQHLMTFDNYEKAKLIYVNNNPSKTSAVLRKQLNLVVENVDEQQTQDISFSYSGYAPLSVRIIQSLLGIIATPISTFVTGSASSLNKVTLDLKFGKFLEDPVKSWTMDFFDEYQGIRKEAVGEEMSKATLIYFIGGCAFSEISAIRFLESITDGAKSFVIMTDSIINGNSIGNSAIKNSSR